jgi:hypothetical protein
VKKRTRELERQYDFVIITAQLYRRILKLNERIKLEECWSYDIDGVGLLYLDDV